MEHHFQDEDGQHQRDILESQIRECFGRVVYSHKTQEKCSDILLQRLSTIKLCQIILSALTTAGFVGAVFSSENILSFAGSIISTLLLILNAYTKNYDLGEIAQKYKQAANDAWLIREKYLSLITDIKIGSGEIESFQNKRDELLGELHKIYGGSPSTNFKAYQEAQNALQSNEELTFSDAEIDAFLPKYLRKGG